MASASQDEEMPARQGDPEPSTRQDDASWRSIHAPTLYPAQAAPIPTTIQVHCSSTRSTALPTPQGRSGHSFPKRASMSNLATPSVPRLTRSS